MNRKADVYVVNKDSKTFSDKYRDDIITIKSGEKYRMRCSEAIRFLGEVSTMDEETGLPRIKNLVIEEIPDIPEEKEKEVYISHLDGKEFSTKEELEKHIAANADKAVQDSDEVAGISCPICTKTVKTVEGLRKHLITHKE